MNKLEKIQETLETDGFEVRLSRSQNSDGTLSDVFLTTEKEFDSMDTSTLTRQIEYLKETIPEYHSIIITISSFSKNMTLKGTWHPRDSKLNPKTLNDVQILPIYCKCPKVSDE